MSVRLNKFIAQSTGLSRRAADQAIADGRVTVNGTLPSAGQQITDDDHITLDGSQIDARQPLRTILLNKPVGYIVSRNGQGGRTIYDLLPAELHHLKPVGRLDKLSSGLLLLTNDGDLAAELTHPRNHKVKLYQVKLSKPLAPLHRQMIQEFGIKLEDGVSRMQLERLGDDGQQWQVTLHEGRNRQIRRTFEALGYNVLRLNRSQLGPYTLPADVDRGSFIELPS